VGGKVNLVLVALSVRTAQTTKARLQRKSVAACYHCQMHCEGTEYSCKHSPWRAQADLVAAFCSACFPEAVHQLRTEPLAATGNTVHHVKLPVVGGTSCTLGGANLQQRQRQRVYCTPAGAGSSTHVGRVCCSDALSSSRRTCSCTRIPAAAVSSH
jgi:hypothetical protein